MEEEAVVKKIIDDVSKNGDAALIKYCKKFDAVNFNPKDLKVSSREIKKALKQADSGFLSSLRLAIKNIRYYHEKQKTGQWLETLNDHAVIGLRSVPIDCAGIYVPGGRASYPSSVLMNAIPAQIAGVKKIVMVTPPGKDGCVNPYVLTAAKELGIEEIYKVGGAQAVAALAFGTRTIPKVDKIVGPGNIYVTLAKKLLYGIVGIDKLAGPSDVVIIADGAADARFIASDMSSQAEHDPLSKAILITNSKKIRQDVKKLLAKTPFIKNCSFYITKTLDEAASLSNKIAPEHLELMVSSPQKLLKKITNAGAIFLGPYSPVAVGDYIAGANHVLPTGGNARFASPLGVYDFVKMQSIIGYTKPALRKVKNAVIKLAGIEGLNAHAESIKIRFK